MPTMSVTQPPSAVEETGERIVLCIDVHDEMDDVLLPAPSIDACTRMALTKRLLKMFVATKLRLATTTVAGGDSESTASGPQFALCLLKERAEWLMDFSADCDLLFAVIDELTITGHYQDLDVRTLFMTVEQNAVRLRARSPRVICIYGRSDVVPSGITDVMVTHGTNPRLTLDLIFLHRRKSSEIDPQKVYDLWTTLESTKAPGYFFEVNKSSRRYLQAMVKLLANANVRPKQENCDFRFVSP